MLTPYNETANSSKKVWRKCTKGSDHEWDNTPYNPEDWYFMWDDPSPRWIKEQEEKQKNIRKKD